MRRVHTIAPYRIEQILRKGSLQRGSLFDVKRLAQKKPGANRFLIIVSGKTAPLAVDRNRIKRRIREALTAVRKAQKEQTSTSATAQPSGTDFAIIAKTASLKAPFEELIKNLSQLIR